MRGSEQAANVEQTAALRKDVAGRPIHARDGVEGKGAAGKGLGAHRVDKAGCAGQNLYGARAAADRAGVPGQCVADLEYAAGLGEERTALNCYRFDADRCAAPGAERTARANDHRGPRDRCPGEQAGGCAQRDAAVVDDGAVRLELVLQCDGARARDDAALAEQGFHAEDTAAGTALRLFDGAAVEPLAAGRGRGIIRPVEHIAVTKQAQHAVGGKLCIVVKGQTGPVADHFQNAAHFEARAIF